MNPVIQPLSEFHPNFNLLPLAFAPRDTQPFTQATHYLDVSIPEYDANSNGFYLKSVTFNFYPTANQSGTIYYNLKVYKDGTGGSVLLTPVSGTSDTKTFTTANAWYPGKLTFNTNLANTISKLLFEISIGGSTPGTFLCNATALIKFL